MKPKLNMADITHIKDLKPDQRNARKHNARNIGMIEDALNEVGAARSIVIDEDGNILAGNGTVEAAAQAGIERVKVVEASGEEIVAVRRRGLTEKQKRRLALFDNRTAELASWDKDVVRDMLAENEHALKRLFSQDEVERAFLQDVDAEDGDDLTDEESMETGIYALREDAVFNSSSEFGIPDLREDMLAADIEPGQIWLKGNPTEDRMVMLFGSNKIPVKTRGGILAFYVDDRRFERVWSDAVRIIENLQQHDFSCIVGADFSVWRDDPVAIQLWNTYRSRWCTRYWQEAGFKVVPSLNWSDEKSFKFVLDGIPKAPPIVSCQCRTTRGNMAGFITGLKRSIETLAPGVVWIYGGQTHREEIEPHLPGVSKYKWLDSRRVRK
jgi:hypothetical protein